MTPIKLFLMRHSKSCSNHMRSEAFDVSQAIRDPGLSEVGTAMATTYGPRLRAKLRKKGFVVDRAIIAASTLRRAQDTAFLTFDRRPITLGHFAENGELPENTPTKGDYTAPQWRHFLSHLSKVVDAETTSVVVVGHGSYLKSLWPRLTGRTRKARLNNLDGILVEADVSPHGLRVHSFKEILYDGPGFDGAEAHDKCRLRDTRKIAAIRRGMTRQRGGMTLAYYQDGAQMRGTSGEATGVGLTGVSNNWVRPALHQTGGRRVLRGGFSPSVMGAFASNGARLLPLASYIGYKMYTNQKGRKTVKKSRRSRSSRSSRRQ